MKRLLAVALLASAALGRAQVEEILVVGVPPPPEPITVTAPLVPPPGAVVLYYADSRCPPAAASVTTPPVAKHDCYAKEARLAILRIVQREKQAPGTASPCWDYTDPNVYQNCLDVAARNFPPQAYGQSAVWVNGTLNGQPWSGCAAGYSAQQYVFAKLSDPPRILPLVAFENANHWLKYTYDRKDLTDGPLVSEAQAAAQAACGGI